MNLITIQFAHDQAVQPKFIFSDRVVILSLSNLFGQEHQITGSVTGLWLQAGSWLYAVRLDSPSGLTEEYCENELAPLG